MATEILEGWTRSKALIWITARIQSSSGCCISSQGILSSVQGIAKMMVISRLKEADLRAWAIAVQELLTDKHKLYHLAFTESNIDRKWNWVIFSDESTFSSANDGLVLVYVLRGEHYNSQYVSTCTHSGHVPVHCWDWISHEGAGMLHCIEGHL